MNDHVAEPFRSILNGFAGEKPSLQNQRVTPKRPTNRDRYDALYAGWKETCLEGVELISFGTFQEGVEEFERVLAERSLDRQYAYEQGRGK
jgi:hypothetical protein